MSKHFSKIACARMLCACLTGLVLAGCASTGITMSEDEAIACKREGCTVWTEAELAAAARAVFMQGYANGKRAAKGDI